MYWLSLIAVHDGQTVPVNTKGVPEVTVSAYDTNAWKDEKGA